MKKLIFVLLIGLLVCTAAFADHPGLGIGVVLGGGGGLNGGSFYPGLSLKLPGSPVFWGLYASLHKYYSGFTVTGDFYIFDRDLISTTATNEEGTYKVKIDWFLGLGGAINMNFWQRQNRDDAGVGFGLGLRIPVGLSWHVVRPFEIALSLVPTFPGLYVANGNAWLWWDISVELALRYWFVNK